MRLRLLSGLRGIVTLRAHHVECKFGTTLEKTSQTNKFVNIPALRFSTLSSLLLGLVQEWVVSPIKTHYYHAWEKAGLFRWITDLKCKLDFHVVMILIWIDRP